MARMIADSRTSFPWRHRTLMRRGKGLNGGIGIFAPTYALRKHFAFFDSVPVYAALIRPDDSTTSSKSTVVPTLKL